MAFVLHALSVCTSSLRLCLLLLAILARDTHALSTSVSRQAIEFPEDIILLRAADEPPFPETAVKTCTLNREKGFSLLTPGFADGMPGVNFVKTPASYINDSAVVCHLRLATNATGHPIPTPAITAGQTTVVVDMGGSPCDIALRKYCPGEFHHVANLTLTLITLTLTLTLNVTLTQASSTRDRHVGPARGLCTTTRPRGLDATRVHTRHTVVHGQRLGGHQPYWACIAASCATDWV